MKIALEWIIVALAAYFTAHLVIGLDYNPTMALITKLLECSLWICAMVYVWKFVHFDGEKSEKK
ncbi:MAG: hypothetical protein ABS948_17700 [Solibacillus sp.]